MPVEGAEGGTVGGRYGLNLNAARERGIMDAERTSPVGTPLCSRLNNYYRTLIGCSGGSGQ